jgi:hypothetical protein
MDPARVNEILRSKETDWKRITRELTAYVHRNLGKSFQLAEEVAQESVTQLFDPRYIRWDPDKESLMAHLMNVAKGRVKNVRKRHDNKLQPTQDDELAELHFHNDDPDSLYGDKVERAEAFARMKQAVANDEIASAMLDLSKQGISEAAEQAAALEVDIVVIRNARRRIAAHSEKVAREMAA